MKVKFRQLPMRIKLTVSFSGPMIVIFVLLLSVSYRIIETQYEEQIIYSADQSFEQAVNFLQNHLQNMNYILELVGSDRKLQDMLSDGSYRIRQEAGDQWRDYWRINDIMTSLELSNKMYQCGIYVPDRLIYAENRYHFFQKSGTAFSGSLERNILQLTVRRIIAHSYLFSRLSCIVFFCL